MQIITSLEELRQKAVGYRAVPVAGELFSDVRTPIEVLRILKECGKSGNLGTIHISWI